MMEYKVSEEKLLSISKDGGDKSDVQNCNM